MIDMKCEVLITQDEAWRRGSTVPLKKTADEAMADAPGVKTCIVLRRTGNDVSMQDGRDVWWHDVDRRRRRRIARREPMDGEDLLFLMYTSGTTAKPKGIVHTTGGYLCGVATTHHYIFDLKPDADVYWCAADIGWVTGHSYIVYGPLCNGATSVLYEGDAGLPRQGSLVGDRRALRRHDPLHGADGDPLAHEVGAGVRGAARPVVVTAARLGRGADQPGGVGVVSRAHRR